MPAPERTLYQFPISHYCEKTRWNLDAKGLPYVIDNLLPGFHRLLTKRLTQGGRGTVPVLVDRGSIVSDSTAIALHLEQAYPDAPALIPAAGDERARVLELEAYFDEAAGKSVRSWFYGRLLAAGADLGAVFFGAYSWPARLIGHMTLPVLRRGIHRQYVRSPEKVEEARVKMMEALERLEREIQGDASRFLVGACLSIADITAASLLAPLVAPEGSPYAARPDELLPPELAQMRAAVQARPAGQWVLRRYREDRQRRAQGFAASRS